MSSQGNTRCPGAAGQPLPDDIDNQSTVIKLKARGRRLTQRTLFQFGTADIRASNGQSKRTQDFPTSMQDSIPWGDHQVSGKKATENGYFRVLSHNVNGLSKANSQVDVTDFARAIADKAVGLFGIQETNRNFQRPHMLARLVPHCNTRNKQSPPRSSLFSKTSLAL